MRQSDLHLKRMFMGLLAFLMVTVVPILEYVQWKNEMRDLVPETGLVTRIHQVKCLAGSATRRSTCNFATV